MKSEDHDDHDLVASGVIQAANQVTITASEKDTSHLNIRQRDDEANGEKEGEAADRDGDEKNDMIVTSETIDPYRYLMRDGGTSCELYKIEVHNLPRYTSYATLKKLFLNKFNLKPHKIKLIGNPLKFAFVALSSEEDRQAALKSVSGFSWKGCKLDAAVATPKADPLALKRAAADENVCTDAKKVKVETEESEDCGNEADISARLNDQVAKLWRLPYAAQLEEKTKIVNEYLIDLHKDIGRMIDHSRTEPSIEGGQESKDHLFKWYMTCKKNFDRKPCSVNPIRPSPVTDGYRNKCEFSFGEDKTVGFRMGSYKQGSLRVARVTDCPTVSPSMKKIVWLVERYVRESSKLQPFDPVTHAGHWRQLMIRGSVDTESALVVLSLEAKDLTDDQVSDEKRLLAEAFSQEPSIASLYMELSSKKLRDQRLHLIFGEPSLPVRMRINGKDLTFSVSPDAFFQINTPAAQVCFETIAELLNLTTETLLLDVCCGTGTIGISLAHRVAKVIGIELNDGAVKDAEKNAAANNVLNIQFMSGKAEDLVMKAISTGYQDGYKEIVAVIDPPRAGLSKSFNN